MKPEVSEIALSVVKSIRQRLEECVNDIKEVERSMLETPQVAVGKTNFSREALARLPWKPYRSGRGAWIFRDLRDPIAQILVDALARNGSSMELHGVQYKFSGQDNKFISKFG